MIISSRTPEGLPSRCPLCGVETKIEFSPPSGDAPCPGCGCLLWQSTRLLERLRTIVGNVLSLPDDEIGPEVLVQWERDSIDLVELVMEIEDEFGIEIPDEDYPRLRTVRDVIEYLGRQRGGDSTR